MDPFAPTTEDYGLLDMPLGAAADAVAGLIASWCPEVTRSELRGSPEELFQLLEPLSMALDRTLLVSSGAWTSYFANGLFGSDVFMPVSRIAASYECTGLRVARSADATIFEAYESTERGGDVTNYRRAIYAARDGKWTFGSTGDPYPFEDVTRYEAKSIRDRFTPAHLDSLLSGLGAPLDPFPQGEDLDAILFVQPDKAPHLQRWSREDVQSGRPWQR